MTMTGNGDVLERLQRLRSLGLRKGAEGLARPARLTHDSQATVLPGEPAETPFGSAWVRTERYPLSSRPDLAQWLGASTEALVALDRGHALAALAVPRVAFIDTETTGLSIGTGTYTFLIGIGTYETAEGGDGGADEFVVRQFFMRDPGEERAQLHLVEEALNSCGGMVTFNGRAFDVPLLHNRFVLAGSRLPVLGAPHLDLLPPARRLWRARLTSCALSELERSILGVQRTADDVPGWMIPGIYHDYYQVGNNTELMSRVFYHNLIDITSMAVLAGHMAWLFELAHLEQHLAELHPLDCASLGRCYWAADWAEAAETAFRAALAAAISDDMRVPIYRELSLMLKRLERRGEAAALWEEWITSVAGDDVTPYVELAKYHEWQTGDLRAARGWAAWAVKTAQGWPPGLQRQEILEELRHRQERIERKLNGQAPDSVSMDPEE